MLPLSRDAKDYTILKPVWASDERGTVLKDFKPAGTIRLALVIAGTGTKQLQQGMVDTDSFTATVPRTEALAKGWRITDGTNTYEVMSCGNWPTYQTITLNVVNAGLP